MSGCGGLGWGGSALVLLGVAFWVVLFCGVECCVVMGCCGLSLCIWRFCLRIAF